MSSMKVQAALGSRALSLGGHDDFNQGQISCRVPDSSRFQIKGALVGFDEATPEDFLEVGVDPTEPVPSQAPPEVPLHQAIYERRSEIAAIVHSHAPAGLVFGSLGHKIQPISHEGSLLADSVGHFCNTSNTVLTIEVGRQIAEALADGVGVFLVNHGTVVVGRSVRHAVVFALMLERACRLQLDAMATGAQFSVSSAEDIDAKRDFIFADLSVRSYWEHTRRRVLRTHPSATDWN